MIRITNVMQGLYHQAVFGDLNTMAHGIARFSPKYCKDKMRFWSIGQSEAEFWDHTVFKVMDPDTIPEQDSLVQQRSSPADATQAADNQPATQTGKEAPKHKLTAAVAWPLLLTYPKLPTLERNHVHQLADLRDCIHAFSDLLPGFHTS